MKTKPRKRIAARSKRMQAAMRLYNKMRKEWLKTRRCFCATPPYVGCTDRIDIHHSRGRISTLLIDQRYWIALCRYHHYMVDRNPIWARNAGMLAQPGDWNRVPKDDETARLKALLKEAGA